MEILNCKPESIKACASLLVEVYSQPEYDENWNEEDAYNYLVRFYNIEPTMCFVALENNKIIGAIFSYSYPWQSEMLVYIQELYVAPNQRNNGVAKALLKSLARNKTVKAWLVANENTSAAGFYEKMGFNKNGPYKFNYGSIST